MRNFLKKLLLVLPIYGIECSAQTVSGQVTGFDYVDLDLPSGRLWATHNMGAASATEFGDFFAWGETAPKTNYADTTYKWLSNGKYTKYCSFFLDGEVDNKSVLDVEDDAATANWGPNWRMPTSEEQEELIEGCNWVFTNDFNGTGVPGCLGTSKTNKATIFLPAAGCYDGDSHWGVGSYGYYLSSTLEYKLDKYVTVIDASSYEISIFNTKRYSGNSVRPVVSHKETSTYYVVSFFTRDSVLIQSQNVEEGMSATPVDAPFVKGHRFSGWSDSSFVRARADLDVYAQYIEADEADPIHDYVDLGLPSGTKWATYNVGAARPYEYGDYFAWGETTTKDRYAWNSYKWCSVLDPNWEFGDFDQLTKYVTLEEAGTVDNKKVLEPEDDAAIANWGKLWRTPSKEDYEELKNGCNWEWIYDYKETGICGYLGRSIANDNEIFFPAAGNRYLGEPNFEHEQGLYWTSSLDAESPGNALIFFFSDWFYDFDNYSHDRYFGQNVRAVLGGSATRVENVGNEGLLVYSTNDGTAHICNALPNCIAQVFDMNGRIVASAVTDANGYASVALPNSRMVYVVTVGNMSCKVRCLL